jgi:hypothetical protein
MWVMKYWGLFATLSFLHACGGRVAVTSHGLTDEDFGRGRLALENLVSVAAVRRDLDVQRLTSACAAANLLVPATIAEAMQQASPIGLESARATIESGDSTLSLKWALALKVDPTAPDPAARLLGVVRARNYTCSAEGKTTHRCHKQKEATRAEFTASSDTPGTLTLKFVVSTKTDRDAWLQAAHVFELAPWLLPDVLPAKETSAVGSLPVLAVDRAHCTNDTKMSEPLKVFWTVTLYDRPVRTNVNEESVSGQLKQLSASWGYAPPASLNPSAPSTFEKEGQTRLLFVTRRDEKVDATWGLRQLPVANSPP